MDMVINIDKEVETFRRELKTDKFSLDNLDNNEVRYNQEKSERDLAAFDGFLQADIFKTLEKEACK